MWNRLRQLLWRCQGIGIATSVISGLVIGLRLTGTLQRLEWTALDQFFQHRTVEPLDTRIVVVTVDEADIAYLKQWPMSDASLAQVLQQIKQQQPRAIGLDFYRDLPIAPGSNDLTQLFHSTPNLIGIQKVIGESQRATVAPPSTLARLGQVAASDVVVDDDGTVRRTLLSLQNYNDQTVLSLPTRLALTYLQAQRISLKNLDPDRGQLQLGNAEFLPLKENDGGYVQADIGGYQILSNFRSFHQEFQQISLVSVLKRQIPPNFFHDRLVFIGTTAASLGDRLHTPRSNSKTNLPGTPGVFLHADVASQLLSAAIEGRPLLRTWADPWEWLWIVVWSLAGTLLGWTLRSPQLAGIGIVLGSIGLGSVAYGLFLQGWWIPLVPPLLAFTGAALLSESYILWASLLLSRRQLQDYIHTLEQKVADRTHELSSQNQQLQQEIYDRQQIELALQDAKEAAEAANLAKGQFLATMSHELRTPLNVILGFTQVMSRDSGVKPHHQNYLSTIVRSGNHLLSLINDVLDLSKIEAGGLTLDENTLDLSELLSLIQEMFYLRATSKGLEFNIDMAPDVPQFIVSDANKIRQLLINLLGNAIKFTQQGQVVLRVGLQKAPHPCSLLLEVEDTGIGIAAADLDQIFDAFVQAEGGKQATEGTGLGLAISRRFVQVMGGEITASSTLGQGSTFRVTLPIRLTEPPLPHSHPYRLVVGLALGQPSYRILVVDDRTDNRQVLISLLAPLGFEVQEARNGQQAITLWEQWQPHLILTDIHMPEMDGYELVQQIRAKEQAADSGLLAELKSSQTPTPPPHHPTPLSPVSHSPFPTKIIALTASALGNAAARALAVGYNDFIHKPFQDSDLFATIAQHLGVRFLYQDEDRSMNGHLAANYQSVEIDWRSALEAVPAEWLVALHHAALSCDDDRALQLVQHLPPEQTALASALTQLICHLQFEQLLQLIQTEDKVSN